MKTSDRLGQVITALRNVVPALKADRHMAGDLERAAEMILGGTLLKLLETGELPTLEIT